MDKIATAFAVIVGLIIGLILVCLCAVPITLILWAIWKFVLCAIFITLPVITFWQWYFIVWFISCAARLIFGPVITAGKEK